MGDVVLFGSLYGNFNSFVAKVKSDDLVALGREENGIVTEAAACVCTCECVLELGRQAWLVLSLIHTLFTT